MKDFQTVWETLKLDKTLAGEALEATIPVDPPVVEDALEGLKLPTLRDAGESAELHVGETLGEGGMGVVRLARQVPLRRDVAVKTLREGATAEARNELLREAWLTGGLEHPNIVPVHALGQDPEGRPVLVMKRIEGRSWKSALEVADGDDPRDHLRRHLDILRQVCRALAFAHDRGILHRDIKPENVMLGPWGEVYLLDWGLAVSLREQDRGRLPLAVDVNAVAGTPRYLAPEMAEGEGKRLAPASDIYLLGAVLHEIITGEPPHSGQSLFAVLRSAWRSEPKTYDDQVPAELAAIAARAMAREPEDRFASVEDFAAALDDFLEHRQSLELTDEADARLPELRRLAAASADSDEELHRVAGELRFAYRQALKTWPGNSRARAGYGRACQALIARELRDRDARAAARLLAEMPDPPPELAARVEALEAELQREQEGIDRLRADLDLDSGAGARARLATGFGIFWTAFPLVVARIVDRDWDLTPTFYLPSTGIYLCLLVVFFCKEWRAITSTASNRRIAGTLVLVGITIFFHRLNGTIRGLDIAAMLGEELAIFGLVTGCLALMVDKRIWPAAVCYWLCAIGAFLTPVWTREWMAAGNGTAMTCIALAWWPGREAAARAFREKVDGRRCPITPELAGRELEAAPRTSSDAHES